MSNVLKRKKKSTFYTKDETKMIRKNDFVERRADNLIEMSYKDFVVIGYIILHDKFGFGQKRIIRLQDTMNTYLDKAGTDKSMSGDALAYFLKEKYKLDVLEKVNSVPQRQLMVLYSKRCRMAQDSTYKITSASMFNYLALTMTALKTLFNLSVKQLNAFVDKFIDYIDTLANFDKYALTVPMIAETLAEEIHFKCDLHGSEVM